MNERGLPLWAVLLGVAASAVAYVVFVRAANIGHSTGAVLLVGLLWGLVTVWALRIVVID